VYLGSNYEKYDGDDVTTICVGADVDWASNLHHMLDKIDSDRVIMFLEDFLLIRNVDTVDVQGMVNIAVHNDVDCLRLKPSPPPPSRRCQEFNNLGVISAGEDYRISTQVAIWKTDLLRKIAMPGFSAWDFEVYGSLLSERLPGKYWGVYEPIIDYRHCLERGRWLEEGLTICRQSRVNVDLNHRDILTKTQKLFLRQQESTRWRSILKRLMPGVVSRRLHRWYRNKKLADIIKTRTVH
jgi:hypothetical protein